MADQASPIPSPSTVDDPATPLPLNPSSSTQLSALHFILNHPLEQEELPVSEHVSNEEHTPGSETSLGTQVPDTSTRLPEHRARTTRPSGRTPRRVTRPLQQRQSRRRRSDSEDNDTEGSDSEDRARKPKRVRLESNMHTQPREEHSGNGTSSEMPSFNTTNGAQKLQGLNGHSNGPSKSRRTYFDHDREEITRLILQALCDLGYDNAAQTLSRESGHELESPSVAAFRTAVLQGEWREAEDLLFGVGEENVDGGASLYLNGLQLAEDADREYMKFQLREQKFLELLEQQDTGRALHILRTELQPLHQDVGKVHFLSA